ncbi:MAG: TIGR00725 family protein [Planctomycetota bacterium]|nr:TIGR00725 family protein [Planctomycetota bacterium]
MPSAQTNRRPLVAVIGSSEADANMIRLAEEVGAVVAKLGAGLVTGGRTGIMSAASKGCAEAGGTVIAVVPGTDMDEANGYAHYVIPTGLGWARNVITGIAGDVIVVIGGAAGTLSEIAFAWMYDRPVIALSGSGGWAEKTAGQALDHRRNDVVIDCGSIAELEIALGEQLRKAAEA